MTNKLTRFFVIYIYLAKDRFFSLTKDKTGKLAITQKYNMPDILDLACDCKRKIKLARHKPSGHISARYYVCLASGLCNRITDFEIDRKFRSIKPDKVFVSHEQVVVQSTYLFSTS